MPCEAQNSSKGTHSSEGQGTVIWPMGRDISRIRQGKLRCVVWTGNGKVVWRKGEVTVHKKATEKV